MSTLDTRVPGAAAVSPSPSTWQRRVARTGTVIVPVAVFAIFIDLGVVVSRRLGLPDVAASLPIFLLAVPVVRHLLASHRLVLSPTFAAVALFGVAQIVSAVASDDLGATVREITEFWLEGVVLVFFLTNAIRSVECLRRAMWAVLAGGALMSLVTVYQWATQTYLRPYGGYGLMPSSYLAGFDPRARAAGPLGDPNYYAQVLLVAVGFGVFVLRQEQARLLRLAAGVAVGLVAFGTLLTVSRGALIAIVLASAAMAALRLIRIKYLAVGLVAVVMALALQPDLRDRIADLGTGGSSDQADVSVQGRSLEMRAAWAAFGDHPAVGVGPGEFPARFEEYAARAGGGAHEETKFGDGVGEVPEREAHNLPLDVASELGALGLAALLGVLGVTFVRLLRTCRRAVTFDARLAALAAGALFGLVAYLAASLFLSLAYDRFLWMTVGFAAVPPLLAATTPTPGAAAARRCGPGQ
jgi:putative inorganic carbon (hco3(-)) transporter